MTLYGLILAGGQSTRMGFDKAQLNFHGTDQVSWLYSLLSNFCDQVFISGNPTKIKGQYEFIEDAYDRGGPMNGILSAFKKYPNNSWLVVPVDMPNLNLDAIRHLVKSHHQNTLATCFIDSSKQVEPLPIILNKEAYPVLLNAFNLQQESILYFLKDNNCQTTSILDPQWLANINKPSQL